MRNDYRIIGDVVEIDTYSPKYGHQIVTISREDLSKLDGMLVMTWGTTRHTSLYARAQLPKGRSKVLSRFLLEPRKGVILDHISGNALDNTRQNLRETDYCGNNCNARKRRNARTSRYKGVSFNTKEQKWKAQIQYQKKKQHIGTFTDELEAAKAYNRVAQELFGEFAKLNHISTKEL